jgi:hypothetical protein
MRRLVAFSLIASLGLVVLTANAAEQAGGEPGGDDGSGCGTITNYRSGSGGSYDFAHTGPGGVQAWAGWSFDSQYFNRKNPGEVQLYQGLGQNYSPRHDYCPN